MSTALAYLLVRSLRGRVIRTLRLLKQPKYLVGVLAFLAWITFSVGGPIFFDDDPGEVHVNFVNADVMYRFLGDAVPALQVGVALVVALLVSLWWLFPWSRMALNLTEAEIHMLTPMPVRRRHLIQYATLKSQPGILFGCFMMTIFLGSGGPLARLRWYALFWVVLTLWDMHSKGRALWLERQKELPAARAWRNRTLLIGAIAAYWIVLGTAVTRLVLELMSLPAPADFQQAINFGRSALVTYGARLESGVIGWLLLPFRWVVAPLFVSAPGVGIATKASGVFVPLALIFAHNEWVVRSQAKFEEAALAHARREAGKKDSAARYWRTSTRSRRRVPFVLASQGAPELGILWKNSMIVTRVSYRTLAFLGLALVVSAAIVPPAFGSLRAVPFIILMIGVMTMAMSPLTGAQSYRNDLRADLLRIEMVRPWPIEGWKLFAAEAAGPTVFASMTALVGAGIVLAIGVLVSSGAAGLDRVRIEGLRLGPGAGGGVLGVPQWLLFPVLVASALPVLLALTAMTASLQNLFVLLFPGWVQLGSAKQQGAAAFGQNMIMFLALGLASLLCLLPAALIIGVIVLIQVWLFDVSLVAWEFPFFGIIAATPVAAATALIVRAGGRVWDKLDPSREILEGTR